ncbi:hypothetical protein EMIHUDRAFT_450763 [Emiliania huxleyi CCMP1516]|uniref:SET domain-containing protein n=2 Tax=Emiliania huxleyi TaxID=2903 RepID=A0A0D3JFN4_EMIH1|nr:hypothetical protein EMIHUDRAFT_450763 [Emiliania huxleyi CCMP1516]EOD22319.1 hypothetical protein EMIHUDRAFT_450763 [Emiliania huxleyi CCMP1516]|eukprot:XP_005774748.1 hypothetical protein EMIHUDRAFT_450763 [Emiliania huxleyi CCMP1516]
MCGARLGEDLPPPGPDVGPTPPRRSGRRPASSPALQLPCDDAAIAALLSPRKLALDCGGASAGGVEATKLLKASFGSLSDNRAALDLTGPFKDAERAVLLDSETRHVLAAAVVHVRAGSVLEVPLFATAKKFRGQGFGSALYAALAGLGRRLGLQTLVVSATDESRAFWVRQGLHAKKFCGAAEKSAMSSLEQRGLVTSFQNTTLMAAPIPQGLEPPPLALDQRDRDRLPGLKARAAASTHCYEDINDKGSFWVAADGSRQWRAPYPADEMLTGVDPNVKWVPYKELEAFFAGPTRGWGLRCTRDIKDTEFVVEIVGRCLSFEEYEQLEDKTYAVGFPENISEAKRAAGDRLQYIDPKTEGGLWRFINDSEEAPNLRLVYIPRFEKPSAKNPDGVLPKRAFLQAAHDIPAGVELTWDYGPAYPRPWKEAEASEAGGQALRVDEGGRRAAAKWASAEPGRSVSSPTPADVGAAERCRGEASTRGGTGEGRVSGGADARVEKPALAERDRATTDRKLWPGAFDAGWRIREACRNAAKNSHWKYVSPEGKDYTSAAAAASASGRGESRPSGLVATAAAASSGHESGAESELEVECEGDKEWFAGVIKSYSSRRGLCVAYDNGETQYEDLDDWGLDDLEVVGFEGDDTTSSLQHLHAFDTSSDEEEPHMTGALSAEDAAATSAEDAARAPARACSTCTLLCDDPQAAEQEEGRLRGAKLDDEWVGKGELPPALVARAEELVAQREAERSALSASQGSDSDSDASPASSRSKPNELAGAIPPVRLAQLAGRARPGEQQQRNVAGDLCT